MYQTIANNSGKGKGAAVPDAVKRFNWGALFLTWIWGLGNNTWLTLIILAVALIPFVGQFATLPLAIYFGMKGNEWAWQNKEFKSIEHFHNYQRGWAIAGTILFVTMLVLSICGLVIFATSLSGMSTVAN